MSDNDYLHCLRCRVEVAYDAGTDYPGGCSVAALCPSCAEDHRLTVVRKWVTVA